jgi:hypothetical protein
MARLLSRCVGSPAHASLQLDYYSSSHSRVAIHCKQGGDEIARPHTTRRVCSPHEQCAGRCQLGQAFLLHLQQQHTAPLQAPTFQHPPPRAHAPLLCLPPGWREHRVGRCSL